ncbi:MAG: secreted hydrolase, partial [bacterium]|nr:secreted hydrolase [bacterium]
GVLLCDGFESVNVSASLWDNGVTQTNASFTVDQTHAHRGQYALHVHTSVVASAGSAEATIAEAHTFSPPGATFWVRAFYYFPSNASAAAATLLDATQKATPNNDVSLAIDHDALSIYNAFNGGSYVASTTPLIPLDAWVCIEWQVDTGTPNQLHAWINGQPVTALDLMQPTTAAQPIGLLSVGLGIFPPNTSSIALDAWVDDVIFDHAPIGCAK